MLIGDAVSGSAGVAVSRRRRITVLNSDPEFLELIDWLLEDEGPYQVTTMRVAETSVDLLAATLPELVLVDIVTSDHIADRLVRDALEHPALAGLPMVIISPATPRLREEIAGLVGRPNVEHLPKPFTALALEELVHRLLPSAE